MVEYPIHSSSSTWLAKMLGYYYPVICTIIKTLATIDETMHSVVTRKSAIACPNNKRPVSNKRLGVKFSSLMSAWALFRAITVFGETISHLTSK